MISPFRFASVLGGATAVYLSFGLPSGSAGTVNCAAYGSGFTAVEGSDTCIRVGGHVRVEVGTGHMSSASNNAWGAGSARPATLQTSSDDTGRSAGNTINGLDLGRSHLRLRPGVMGYADPIR